MAEIPTLILTKLEQKTRPQKNYKPVMLSSTTGVLNPRAMNRYWNQAAQQEVSGRRAREASCAFTATPHHSHYRLSSASCQISGSIRFS